MKVKVKFYAAYRDITGLNEDNIILDENTKVEDLLHNIFNKYGEKLEKAIIDSKTGNLNSYVKVFKNGKDIELLEGLSTKLDNDDLIVIFPPVAGG